MRLPSFALPIAAVAATAIAFVPSATAQGPKATTLERVSGVVQPGIVYLETTYQGIVAGRAVETTASCTGFFVNPDGDFVTAGHCVDKADGRKLLIKKWLTDELNGAEPAPQLLARAYANLKVRSLETPARTGPDREVVAAYGVDYGGLPTGKPLPARVLGFRPFERGDVAVATIEADNVPVLQLAPSSSIAVGTQVVSVGYPGSVKLVTDQTFDPSFKDGTISSEKTIGDGLVDVYEISAAVSPGMSGGPTVDLQGRVVGVNSFGISGEPQPFNFISPVSEIEGLLADEGIENRLDDTNVAYRAGLAAYYAGDRDTAIARLDDVLGQVPEHEFAQELKAKALRLPVQEEDGGGFPTWLLILLIALVLAAAAAGTAWALRRRGGPSAAPDAGAALVVSGGPLNGTRFPVGKERMLGREGDGIVVDDPEISRRHLSIAPVEGGLLVTDLESANGTAVNGRRIDRPTVVVDGDAVKVGDTTLAVDLPGSRAADRTRLRAQVDGQPAPTLVVSDGPLAGEKFIVDRELVVGRADADITLKDPEVSRRHARVRAVNGGVEVEDLGSANGTAVNGVPVTAPTRVGEGDVIRFGQTSLAIVPSGHGRTLAAVPPEAERA